MSLIGYDNDARVFDAYGPRSADTTPVVGLPGLIRNCRDFQVLAK